MKTIQNICIFAAGVAADQITKYYSAPNPLYINTGISFSIFSGYPGLILFLGAVTFAAMMLFYRISEIKISGLSLALFISGAVGNTIDRIFRGHVIDWIYAIVYINIADILLISGGLGILLQILIETKSKHK